MERKATIWRICNRDWRPGQWGNMELAVKQGSLKRETEALITAAQDQAIRTNCIKATIDKSQIDAKCRICRDRNETVSHIVSVCSKLAQKEYKKRHDNVARAIHLDLSGKCGFDRNDKWYNHVPESVLENENYKLLWDFSIRTDHHIEARRPDLVLVNKSTKSCHIKDVAIPEDSGVKEKEAEKYQNLTRELRRMWEVKTKVVPIVLGALRTVPLRLKGNLKDLGVDTSITLIYPDICTAGISKDTKKSIGNVKVGTRKHFGVPWQLVVAQHHNFTSR